jgi:hypothetical protein
VLICFGYPQAHEDDAEQAMRAAFAVIEAVSLLAAHEDLRVRLGIATGLAVVGDLIGEGAAQERGVIGETPNLAARLQALATPNTLVIAEATRRQIGELFELEDLGPRQLGGFTEDSPEEGPPGRSRRFHVSPPIGRDQNHLAGAAGRGRDELEGRLFTDAWFYKVPQPGNTDWNHVMPSCCAVGRVYQRIDSSRC